MASSAVNRLPQLFCFTFAGGTASFFDQIERDLAGEIEVIKLEYAGHGSRHREALYTDFASLADDMFTQLKEKYNGGLDDSSGDGGSYALFGYSMGTITLVEVLRRLLASALPLPARVFLAAHEPHTKSELLSFTPNELDEWVKERTLRFGTVPEKLINNQTFWRMYLPLYRHDYTLLAHYKFPDLQMKCTDIDGSDNLPLETSIPATIFYSETDTPLVDMKLWEKYFRGQIEYCRYEGQHFFIQQHHEEMARIIKNRMIGITEDGTESTEATA